MIYLNVIISDRKRNKILSHANPERTLPHATGGECFDSVVEFVTGTRTCILIKMRLPNFIELKGQLSCCGVNNFTDFNGTPWMKNKNSNHLLPASCCKLAGRLIDFRPAVSTCQSSPTDDNSYQMKVWRNSHFFKDCELINNNLYTGLLFSHFGILKHSHQNCNRGWCRTWNNSNSWNHFCFMFMPSNRIK